MRKNNLKKRKNIFEVLGIKQDNKKWLVLVVTIMLTGYLLFSLIYAPISCINNIKAKAETQNDRLIYITRNEDGNYVIPLYSMYMIRQDTYYGIQEIKLTITTRDEFLTVPDTYRESLWETKTYTINKEASERAHYTTNIYYKYYNYNFVDDEQTISQSAFQLERKQFGNVELNEITYITMIQRNTNNPGIGLRIYKDSENYIQYILQDATYSDMELGYTIIEPNTEQETLAYVAIYDNNYSNIINSQNAKNLWYQYFLNEETFKDTYKDYWYEYYYWDIYNEGIEAGWEYSDSTFYTLIDAVTFGAIKPLYSMLNFELLGINIWNLATSIFTVLIIVIIVKFIGAVL